MSDNLDQTTTQTTVSNATTAQDPLSNAAEEYLAHNISALIGAPVSSEIGPKSVKEVIAEMAATDIDELSIALDFGPGESGIDQVSWNLEVNTLKRAFAKKQASSVINQNATMLKQKISDVKAVFDASWVQKTEQIEQFSRRVESTISRQQLDDFQHLVFGHGEYEAYLEASIIQGAGNNVRKTLEEFHVFISGIEKSIEEAINTADVEYQLLAKAIIENDGDIDKTVHNLEKNAAIAEYTTTLESAKEVMDVLSQDSLNDYRRWSYGLDLNIREILATEKSVGSEELTEKSLFQLRDLFEAGKDRLMKLLGVIH
jgi:hypothetical protein